MGLNRRGSEREFDWSSSPCSLTLPLTLQVQEKKIPGTTVTGRWLKQDAHRKHRIAPRATWHALRSVELKKRCSTRDEAPKAKTAYLKTSRPVLVLYFPTTGKHLLYWKELQFSPTGKGQRRTYRVVHLPGPLESLISFDFVVNISCYWGSLT